jgi:hypothetical protein
MYEVSPFCVIPKLYYLSDLINIPNYIFVHSDQNYFVFLTLYYLSF